MTPPDTTPPHLEVTYPTHGAIVTEEVIRFRGLTEPGAQVSSGRYAADVNADGTGSLVLVLAPGDNGGVFTASDAAGNETTVRMVVTLNRCADMTPALIPDSATKPSSVTGDLDGNGVDDTITVYVDATDDTPWVHMALDYGYAASVLIEDAQLYYPKAITTVKFDSSNAVALVHVGGGATNEMFGVFALVGCDAVQTTSPDGGFFGFNVGASMRYAFGATCTADGIVFRESWLVEEHDDWEDGLWDIIDLEFAYASDRGHFDLVSSTTTQLTWSEIQEQDVSLCHFDCPGASAGC